MSKLTWTRERPTQTPFPVLTRETKTWGQVIGRVMDKIEPVTESGCWIWTGATKGKDEYGVVYVGLQCFRVHRLLYQYVYGPIPVGLVIDHLCRVRLCCNPYHLEAVTNRINILRGQAPHILRMNASFCINGHKWTEGNTRWTRGRRFCRACEKVHGYEKRRRLGMKVRFPMRYHPAGPIPEPEEGAQ